MGKMPKTKDERLRDEERRTRLKELVREAGGVSAYAGRLGIMPSSLVAMLNRRSVVSERAIGGMR